VDYIHTKCGGKIDSKDRRCLKCKKKWNWLTWLLNNEIRPVGKSNEEYKEVYNRELRRRK